MQTDRKFTEVYVSTPKIIQIVFGLTKLLHKWNGVVS